MNQFININKTEVDELILENGKFFNSYGDS